MDYSVIQELFLESIKVTLYLALPVLLVGLVVGLLIAIFQATTQIQEQNLSFVPKLIVTFIVLIVTASWMGTVMIDYTMKIFDAFEKIIS